MSLFKETADIQTADMLDLPVPKANYHNVLLKPSEQQKEMVQSLAKCAEKVRNKMVNSSEDNMLLITNDGRKLALDQRLMGAFSKSICTRQSRRFRCLPLQDNLPRMSERHFWKATVRCFLKGLLSYLPVSYSPCLLQARPQSILRQRRWRRCGAMSGNSFLICWYSSDL